MYPLSFLIKNNFITRRTNFTRTGAAVHSRTWPPGDVAAYPLIWEFDKICLLALDGGVLDDTGVVEGHDVAVGVGHGRGGHVDVGVLAGLEAWGVLVQALCSSIRRKACLRTGMEGRAARGSDDAGSKGEEGDGGELHLVCVVCFVGETSL